MQLSSAQDLTRPGRQFGSDNAQVTLLGSGATNRQFTGLRLFSVIVLLHLFLVWTLVCGGGKKMASPAPVEVFATMIAAEAPVLLTALPQARPKQIKTADMATPTVPQVSEIPRQQLVASDAFTAPVSVELIAAVSPNIAPALPAAQPKSIASDVEYIRPPQPVYPVISRRMHEQGKTVLRVLINEKGLPEKAEIKETSGSTRLDAAALSAVLGALFKPFIENGKPAAVYALVPIRFQLDV
jgi:protein TonB